MKNKINITKIPSEWSGFQRDLIPSPRCEGCEKRCTVLYDSHHDEYFGLACGTVIMEQGHYILPYEIDCFYNIVHSKSQDKNKKQVASSHR